VEVGFWHNGNGGIWIRLGRGLNKMIRKERILCINASALFTRQIVEDELLGV